MVMSAKQRACVCLFSAIVTVLYVCLGSILFTCIEKPNQDENITLKMKRAERLHENINLLRNYINISMIDQSLISLLNETYHLAFDSMMFEYQSSIPWNFFSGIHFCLTAITTVGYGYITPVTQLGRGLCIPYVLVGIPINIFFSANLGYFIARGISKFYNILARLCKKIFFRRKTKAKVDAVDMQKYEAEVHSKEIGLSNFVETEDDYNGNDKQRQRVKTVPYTSSSRLDEGISSVPYPQDDEEEFSKEVLTDDHKSTKDADVPTWFIVGMLVAFCVLVSFTVYNDEKGNWTYVDCLYQVVMTFTTVGFGDLTYSSQVYDGFIPVIWRVVHQNLVLEIGLIMMAASITLWSEKFKQNVKKAKTSIRKHGKDIKGAISNIRVTSHSQNTA